MESLVDKLCSPECAGREAGSAGGIRARGLVLAALRDAGLDPEEQAIRVKDGANLIATLPGKIDRWVVVGAHYDHLGGTKAKYFPGADDNAASVAILVEAARTLAANRPDGRGVIIAAFDAEEPPHFRSNTMGSEYFVEHSPVALDKIDMMVCLELVGHALGSGGMPGEVRNSLFALGAERSVGTSTSLEKLETAEAGLIIRRADAEIIPPLSDYDAFWRRQIPFLLLTGGRTRRYHTRQDLPEHLDFKRMRATASFIDRFVRATCVRDEARVQFRPDARDDASTLKSFSQIVEPLSNVSPLAAQGRVTALELLAQCDAEGRLPKTLADSPSQLISALENALA